MAETPLESVRDRRAGVAGLTGADSTSKNTVCLRDGNDLPDQHSSDAEFPWIETLRPLRRSLSCCLSCAEISGRLFRFCDRDFEFSEIVF